MIAMRVIALTAGVCIALLAASGLRAHERITTTVTWDREISAIVKARCISCHRDGGRAPMSLATWAEARPWARAIRHEVMTRRMPIWHAARGYGDYANDPSLSPFEIALVAAWVDGGAPRSFVPKGSPSIRLPGPAETPLTSDASVEAPHPFAREVSVPCGDSPAPTGRLLGFRPVLQEHGSVRIRTRRATGHEESLGWIRDFDPKFPETYWLRSPLELQAGSRIHVASTAAAPFLIENAVAGTACRVTLLVERFNAR